MKTLKETFEEYYNNLLFQKVVLLVQLEVQKGLELDEEVPVQGSQQLVKRSEIIQRIENDIVNYDKVLDLVKKKIEEYGKDTETR